MLCRWPTLMIPVFALAPIFLGCGDSSVDATKRQVTLSFQARVGTKPADCSSLYSGLGSSGADARLSDARLFASEFELRASSGEWIAVDLDSSNWQRNGVALLDFEDATGACTDTGTSGTNKTVTGQVPSGSYDAVRFRVGVPFDLNHVDSVSGDPPLNVPGMFWTWQGGHKFLRVDWMVEGGAVPRWNVHIGSTGCDSSAPTEAPTSRCSRPNTVPVQVDAFDVDADVIDVDLASLVETADIAANKTGTSPGCMSGPDEPQDCTPVFSSLGLRFDDGNCIENCVGQTVFSKMK